MLVRVTIAMRQYDQKSKVGINHELIQRPGRGATYFITYLACFLRESRSISPGMAALTMD